MESQTFQEKNNIQRLNFKFFNWGILQNGIGVEKDYKEAIKYYKMAILRGILNSLIEVDVKAEFPIDSSSEFNEISTESRLLFSLNE